MNNQEKRAVQWLSNEIKQIPNIIFKKDIQESFTLKNKKKAPPLCEITLFKYDAAIGNTNGYWDKFPLVLIVRPLETHFFGFNLHYIQPDDRIKIIDTVLHLNERSTNRMDSYKRIYPFLDALVKFGAYNNAYKNYNYNNMASKFIIINPKYYTVIKDLPIARFKENKE